MAAEYYIQDTRSYVGNAVVWWRPEGKGYTTNIDEAGLFTRKKAALIQANRATDKAWPEEAVRGAILRYVDAQRLSEDMREELS
jgi:hypothetical protein